MIVLDADPSPVYALAFAPDGDRLVAGTKAGGVRFYGPFGPDPGAPESPQLGIPVNAVDHSPDGDWVATGTSVGWFARSADGRAAGPLFQNRSQSRGVTAVRFVTPSLLAVGVGDRTRPASGGLEIWDVTTNKLREPRHPAPDGVRAVGAMPHLRRVAWAEWGRRACVWDLASPAAVVIPLPHPPAAIALHPAGDRVAVAAQWAGGVYDVATRQEAFPLKGHKGVVTSVAYTPDGRRLVTGSWDGTVKTWHPDTGEPLATHAWPVGKVCSLAFSPDGLRLAVGGDKGAIVVVDFD